MFARRLSVLSCAGLVTLLSYGSHGERVATARPVTAIDESRPQPAPIVVLMTIDGVRWQDVFHGADPALDHGVGTDTPDWRVAENLMPHLHRLARTQGFLFGSDATPMRVSNSSTVSLPGYLEIFTGRSPVCSNNDCPGTSESTLLDTWLQHEPNAELAVISSWSGIARAAAKDLSSIVVSAGQSVRVHEERFCATDELCRAFRAGIHTSAWPGIDDYRPDGDTSALAVGYLRTHQPRFLFVGLGDTDEHAHRGDYHRYLRALHAADATLGALSHWLEEESREGHPTLLICTADHGRSRSFNHHGGAPEASRVWALFAGSVVASRDRWVAPATRLADIAPTLRSVLGLPMDPAASGHSVFRPQRAGNLALASRQGNAP